MAAAATALEPFLDLPIALFGHSVGAIASFELAHRLVDQFGVTVRHLFVSGARAPQFPRNRHRIHDLPEDEFITELKRLNGTPPEVLENPELMRMISTTLRADFAIAETYSSSNPPPLNCPITAFGGLDDATVSREELEAWKIHTTSSFDLMATAGRSLFHSRCRFADAADAFARTHQNGLPPLNIAANTQVSARPDLTLLVKSFSL